MLLENKKQQCAKFKKKEYRKKIIPLFEYFDLIYVYLENNSEINHRFTKYLKESCGLNSNSNLLSICFEI